MKISTEEYDNPTLYDQENEQFKGEIPFLLKLAKSVKGPIVDIACGTGRATIPLAQAGHSLIGVDIHNGMLNEARKKGERLNVDIEWIEQDCTKLHLNVTSSFIFSVGNSFQHFLTNEEQDAFLSSINRHLQQDGLFVFGTRFPSKEELLQSPEEEYWKSYMDSEYKVDVYTISHYDSLSQIQHYTTIRKYINEDRKLVDEKRTNISLRYTYPKEMERLLSTNGLEIVNVFKDWKETPISNDSYEMVYVCRKIKNIV